MHDPKGIQRANKSMKRLPIRGIILALISLSLPACHTKESQSEADHHKIVLTSPEEKDVGITQRYVCQIHAQRNINVCAQASGYLDEILVSEGQEVKKGDVMFKIRPILYKAKYEAELAEAKLAELELSFSKQLSQDSIVSKGEVSLYKAKLDKATAKANLAEAELRFTDVKAPFDGIIDHLHEQLGSLIKDGDILTTMSDTRLMWVYFNVPEARYLEYKARQGKSQNVSKLKLVDSRIELVLADGTKFNQSAGDTVTVEGKFNNETGNIPFRADFPNPDLLLRHGQTGTVVIHRPLKNALVIPQRATFEILDKRYVYVVGKDNVVHQRWITVEHELDDIFVIGSGLEPNEKFVLDGVRQVHDGQEVEDVEFHKPEAALAHLKYHAE